MIRFVSVLTCASLIILMASCKEDAEEPKDTTDPAVSIVSTNLTEYLNGTVNIQAEIVEENLKTASIFIDGNLLNQFDSPSAKIEWQLDTKQFTDGRHTVKVTAKDEQGNTGEASAEIEVLNTLVTFRIPAIFFNIRSGVEYWAFLNDENGALLGVQQMASDVDLTFENSVNFKKGQTFNLTVFKYYYVKTANTNANWYLVTTYSQLSPGKYSYPSIPSDEVSQGSYSLKITDLNLINRSDYDNLYVVGPHVTGFSGTVNGSTMEGTVNVSADNAKAIVLASNYIDNAIVPLYKPIEALSNGQSGSVSTGDFVKMDQVFFPEIEGASYFLYVIDGLRDVKNMRDRYNIFSYGNINVSNDQLNIYYPGNFASVYDTYVQYVKDNETYIYSKVGDRVSSLEKIDAQIDNLLFQNEKIELKTSGDYDVAVVSGDDVKVIDGITQNYSWGIQLPSNLSGQQNIPQLPSVLTERFKILPSLKIDFTAVSLTDYDQINGYIDYIEHNITNGAILADHIKGERTYMKSFSASDGRRINNPMLPAERLKRTSYTMLR